MSQQIGEKDSIKPDFNELKGLEKKYQLLEDSVTKKIANKGSKCLAI